MMNRTTSRVAIGAALLTTFFLLSIESAQAQSNRLRATIPFAFYSNEGVLPAGDYDIERLGSGVAKLFNRDSHAVVVSNTISISNRTGQSVSAKLVRSEEHTSELQSRFDLVCRLLLEKK